MAIELGINWRHVLSIIAKIALIVLLAVVLNAVIRAAIARLIKGVRDAAKGLDLGPGSIIGGDAHQRAEARARTLSSVLRSVTTGTIFFVTVLLVLGELNINLTPLIAGAGVASIAIGFGAQSLVKDVVSGVFILLEDQFGVGDTIDAGEATGTVEQVTLRSTRLRDVAGTVWHIPNGQILRVGNKSQNWASAVVDVTVASNTDLTVARRVIADAAAGLAGDPAWVARIHGEPDEQGVQAFTALGVTLRIVVDTQPASQWKVERELRQRIKAAFDEAGLALAVSVPGSPPQPG